MTGVSEQVRKSRMTLTRRQWCIGIIVFVLYLGAMLGSSIKPLTPALFYPASAIALSALYLEGFVLWPFISLAAILGTTAIGEPIPFIILMPVAQTLQAFLGAYILRRGKIDPLFRHTRDILLLFGATGFISFIVPTFGSASVFLSASLFKTYVAIDSWGSRYVMTAFCTLIVTPFLLRWITKPRFSRTPIEILEIVSVFLLLIVVDFFLFIHGIRSLFGVPLVYVLLLPLFWIGLRLRPRFVTLALVITALFGYISLYTDPHLLIGTFDSRLFQTETFLIIVGIIFFTISSLEEDRRLNTNLMHSQLATLENAVSRITSESRAKNDFIAVLAHELRNPLAPVVSAIELLKLKGTSDTEERETIEMMDGRMAIVRSLLDDLLDISRISEGKISLKHERVDIETVARRAILSTAHHFKERHEQFTFKPPKKPLSIYGDSVRLEQIISNLLTNASKYSDPGDQVTLSISEHENQCEIIVRDTGIGIDTSVIEHIFTPFHQVELGTRSKKGLGIGLALVRSFVEMHGGTVTVASEGSGKGSTFTVLLPLMADMPEESVMNEAPSTLFNFTPKKQNMRILVVDDNDAAAWGIGRLLEMRGCAVEYAYTGRQAIEKTSVMKLDAVLLDVGLPDMEGYEVASAIRSQGFTGTLIALTGYSTDEDKRKSKKAGFDHYLVKPAGLSELQKVLPEI